MLCHILVLVNAKEPKQTPIVFVHVRPLQLTLVCVEEELLAIDINTGDTNIMTARV